MCWCMTDGNYFLSEIQYCDDKLSFFLATQTGVGVLSFFSLYVGSGPASTIHQKKKKNIRNFKKKNI